MDLKRHTFRKRERMRLRTDIDRLFSAGNKSFSAFPVRAVCRAVKFGGVEVCVLISVPKRHLHHAVDRNRVKRQLREAYRLNKDILVGAVAAGNEGRISEERLSLHVALVWLSKEMFPSESVEKKVKNLLHRMAEKMFPPVPSVSSLPDGGADK